MSSEPETIEVLFSADQIASKIEELAHLIAQQNLKDLVVVPILNGSFIFAADLLRALSRVGLSPKVDFLSLASYHGAQASSGDIQVLRDLKIDIENCTVLIIDDILETGRTLNFAKQAFLERKASTVLTCVLLNKDVPRACDVDVDFYGFQCPDIFVVGYGMDVRYQYRELSYIGYVNAPDSR